MTLFRDCLSNARVVRMGVPHGSCLSPTLFNFYVSDVPTPPPGICLSSYADDFNSFTSGTNLSRMTSELNTYLSSLTEHCEALNLQISARSAR